MRFTQDHEWVELTGDVATIGITAYAAEQLGDVVTVRLPESGAALKAGDSLATLEGVNATSDLKAPIAGEVTEANGELAGAPEMIQQDPENSAWLVKIKASDTAAVDALMDRAAYEAFLDTL